MGRYPIATIGLGKASEYSRIRMPKPPQNRTTFTMSSPVFEALSSFKTSRRSAVTLDPFLQSGLAAKMAILLGAQLIAQAALGQFNVRIRNRLVFGYISKQPAPFRNTHGQEILLCTDGGILDQAVGHESTDPIQHVANLEVALGDCNHLANWCAERSHCGIAKQGSAGDG